MTAHSHTTVVDGCYRCDLNRDEVQHSRDWDDLERVIERALQTCRFPDDLAIDAAEAVLNWLGTEQGMGVARRAASAAP